MIKILSIFESKRSLYIKAFASIIMGFSLIRMPAYATPPVLGLPVDCEMGKVCTIHKYMDHDPTPERRDYACGRLSLDGDTGTDFRTPNYVVMEKGIAVLAAANGIVRATRDGMEDISVRKIGRDAIRNREAGNAVVLAHSDGWETQYSHLKKGSVRVKRGDQIKAGDVIGLIGLSGNTEFPHVEFTVRHNGMAIDPFVGEVGNPPTLEQSGINKNTSYNCGDRRNPLWSGEASKQLAYQPTGLLTAGFSIVVPEAEQARLGSYDQSNISQDSPALIFWADVFGTLKGDIQQVSITKPDGTLLIENRDILEKNNIAWFMFTGKRRPKPVWPTGTYEAHYTLSRKGQIIIDHVDHLVIP